MDALEQRSDLGMDRIAHTFRSHNQECARQLSAAGADLARLQMLLDEAMQRMSAAFGRISAALDEGDSHAVVVNLQYQDICGQLLASLRRRLACTEALVGGLSVPFAAAMAVAGGNHHADRSLAQLVAQMDAGLEPAHGGVEPCPVAQAQPGCGAVELF